MPQPQAAADRLAASRPFIGQHRIADRRQLFLQVLWPCSAATEGRMAPAAYTQRRAVQRPSWKESVRQKQRLPPPRRAVRGCGTALGRIEDAQLVLSRQGPAGGTTSPGPERTMTRTPRLMRVLVPSVSVPPPGPRRPRCASTIAARRQQPQP